jgi:hypothetical protein
VRAISPTKIAQVLRLYDEGASLSQIERRTGVSRRTARKYLEQRTGAADLRVLELPTAIPRNKLSPQALAMLEPSVEAFKAFFDRFSSWELAPHSEEFVRQALTSRRVLLNVPPRHAKSRIFSIWLPIWELTRERDTRILVVSKAKDLALDFVRSIADQLEFNEDLIATFGAYKPEASVADSHWRPKSGALEVAGRVKQFLVGDLSLHAQGSLSHVIGRGYDLIICDDVVDLENSGTPEQRDKLLDWFQTEVMSRREPHARIVVVGTRLHEEDLYGRLSGQTLSRVDTTPLWRHINYPAVSNSFGQPVLDFANGRALWPTRWPLTDKDASELSGDEEFTSLEAIYRDLGETRFERTYQQSPNATGDRLVRSEWLFGGKTPDGLDYSGCVDAKRELGQPAIPEDGYVRVVSVDPSGSWFWAFTVVDVKAGQPEFECRLLEVFHGKFKITQAREHLERIAQTYRPTVLIVEVNAMAKWLAEDSWTEEYKRRHSIRVIAHSTQRNKSDPALGTMSMGADFEFGRIRIPYAGEHTRAAVGDFLDELLAYPDGRRDDMVMSLWFIKNNHRKLRAKGRSGPIAMDWTIPNRMLSRKRAQWP